MTDIALSPCPHCGGKEHEIGVGNDGHSVTCHSFSCRSSTGLWPTREQAIAAWNRRASLPQVGPANPVQVMDALFDKYPHQDEIERIILRRIRENRIDGFTIEMAHEIAAIGAGGQAVAWKDATGTELHKLILNYQKEDMIASGGKQAERAANYSIPLYAQPHPADERVVEVLREIVDLEGQAGAGGKAVNIAKAVLSAKEGR